MIVFVRGKVGVTPRVTVADGICERCTAVCDGTLAHFDCSADEYDPVSLCTHCLRELIDIMEGGTELDVTDQLEGDG